ncbi:MAG: DUF1611 domain-containing protein [Gammaproteobacteria bacterium]|nr:MAG: DUF1611 domain-containing protein [Gammaproteobacteria bacterium]
MTAGHAPRSGDLLLARVGRVGQHKRLERPDGRRAQLFAGDHVVVAYGQRYAPDQFGGVLPPDLGRCALVAAGGIAAQEQCRHRAVSAPTVLEPVGLLADGEGHVLNLMRYALNRPGQVAEHRQIPALAVFGNSMNVGKTTTVARLALGLTRAGRRVACVKVTGTGAGGDYWMMRDAGAVWVGDFTDMGHATTVSLSAEHLEAVATGLIGHAGETSPDVILVEVADGLLQRETALLADSPALRDRVDGILFAGADAMSTLGGVAMLRQRGHRVLGVSGAFTAAPLAMAEVAAHVDVPVLEKTDLSDPSQAMALLDAATEVRSDETAQAV